MEKKVLLVINTKMKYNHFKLTFMNDNVTVKNSLRPNQYLIFRKK